MGRARGAKGLLSCLAQGNLRVVRVNTGASRAPHPSITRTRAHPHPYAPVHRGCAPSYGCGWCRMRPHPHPYAPVHGGLCTRTRMRVRVEGGVPAPAPARVRVEGGVPAPTPARTCTIPQKAESQATPLGPAYGHGTGPPYTPPRHTSIKNIKGGFCSIEIIQFFSLIEALSNNSAEACAKLLLVVLHS